MTDVELVMVIGCGCGGAAGRRRFRRVPLDVNGTPDGRYAGRQARRLRAAVALPAVKRFVARSWIEPTVIEAVNSWTR